MSHLSQTLKKHVPRFLIFIVITAAVGGLGYSAYYYYAQYQNILQNPQLLSEKESEHLLTQVGKLIYLSETEKPTIYSIVDKDKLNKDQPFLAKAENGDRMIVYIQDRKAILFRPSLGKIVDVAPVNFQDEAATGSAKSTAMIKVAFYNGSIEPTSGDSLSKELTTKAKNVVISENRPASRSDYASTLVVDLAGKDQVTAGQIAALLGGQVGSFPDGETKPVDANFLVITGGVMTPSPSPVSVEGADLKAGTSPVVVEESNTPSPTPSPAVEQIP